MAKHNVKVKVNIPMFIAICLFCLTLLSINLTSGLYAKYVTSSSSNDSARVITFGDITISESGDFYEAEKLMVIPGVDLTKKAVVNFTGSEAATYVFVEVDPSAMWQTTDNQKFNILLNGKTAMQWGVAEGWIFLKEEKGTYIYYNVLEPNAELNKVDIIAEGGKITVSDKITKNEISSLVDVSVKLRATAVQSGGFATPETAWNSVSAKGGI